MVGAETGMTAKLTPHQTNVVHEHPAVSAVTKATVANLANPALLKVDCATCVTTDFDPNESESLLTTMDMGCQPNVTIEGVHPSDKKCGITVDGTFLELDWDDDAVFFSISKPTEEELGLYEILN